MKKRIFDIIAGFLMIIVGMIMIMSGLKTRDMFMIKWAFIVMIIGSLTMVIEDKDEVTKNE